MITCTPFLHYYIIIYIYTLSLLKGWQENVQQSLYLIGGAWLCIAEWPGIAQEQGVFWSALGGVLDLGPARSKLQDVACLSYTVAHRPHVPGQPHTPDTVSYTIADQPHVPGPPHTPAMVSYT